MKTQFILLITLIAILLSSCSKEKKNITTEKNYAKLGQEYAQATQKNLGKNLMQAISKDGTVGAIGFCKLEAAPITNGMEAKFNTSIKRASDKYRNPANKATDIEAAHIKTFKALLKNGKGLKSIVEKGTDGKTHYYAPIMTNQVCLQCHGVIGSDIKSNTLAKLKVTYPNDLATGYSLNQVRGIWNITFKD